jgi:hypothetical protein
VVRTALLLVTALTVIGAVGLALIPTTPTPPRAAMPFPTRSVAMYHMVWSDPEATPLSAIPDGVNVLNLAFAQGDPPALPGWGAEGEDGFAEAVRALRARGVRIVLSVGGEDGEVDLRDRRSFVDGVMAVNDLIPLDGIDWDVETEAPVPLADVVAISTELRRLRGEHFAVTLAPNGSNVGDYLELALALEDAGLLTRIGQQFYDAVVSREEVLRSVSGAVSAGIPAHKYAVGMMVGDGDRQWTVDECEEHLASVIAEHPSIGGAYLWESGRAGAQDWAERVEELLGS